MNDDKYKRLDNNLGCLLLYYSLYSTNKNGDATVPTPGIKPKRGIAQLWTTRATEQWDNCTQLHNDASCINHSNGAQRHTTAQRFQFRHRTEMWNGTTIRAVLTMTTRTTER